MSAIKTVQFIDAIGQRVTYVYDLEALLEVVYTKENGEVRRVDYNTAYPSKTGEEAVTWFTFNMYRLELGLMRHGQEFSINYSTTEGYNQRQLKLFR